MPAGLSPSPPVLPRASNSPEAMSLTETSRPIPETHLLHPMLSYMTDAPSPRNLRQATFSTSQMALPPLQARQPNEPGYNAYRRDPNLVLHPIYHGQQGPATPLSCTSIQSYQPPSFSPANWTPSEQYAGMSSEKRLEGGSSPPEPIVKHDDSEEMSYFSETLATLPSPSCKQAKPVATLHGNPGVAHQESLLGLSPRGDISRQMGISSLISNNDPRFERRLPILCKS
jgi:hypothetical protein